MLCVILEKQSRMHYLQYSEKMFLSFGPERIAQNSRDVLKNLSLTMIIFVFIHTLSLSFVPIENVVASFEILVDQCLQVIDIV